MLIRVGQTQGSPPRCSGWWYTEPWAELARVQGLSEPHLARLTSAWHTDADLGRPMEVMADMGRSHRLGFTDYQSTPDSFTDLFDRLRQERLIP